MSDRNLRETEPAAGRGDQPQRPGAGPKGGGPPTTKGAKGGGGFKGRGGKSRAAARGRSRRPIPRPTRRPIPMTRARRPPFDPDGKARDRLAAGREGDVVPATGTRAKDDKAKSRRIG